MFLLLCVTLIWHRVELFCLNAFVLNDQTVIDFIVEMINCSVAVD